MRKPVHRAGLRCIAIAALLSACVTMLAAEDLAVISGDIGLPGAGTVGELRVRLQPQGDNPSMHTVNCIVDAGSFECSVPAGTFDLEVYAPGYVRAYRWDVELRPQQRVDLGTVALTSGAAVTGKVLDRGYGISGVNIELAPAKALASPAGARRNRLRVLQTTTNRKGVYAFSDVESGTYSFIAQKEGFSSAALRGVKIKVPAFEPEAIVLKALTTIRILVDPPIDYQGLPWQIRLNRALPESRHYQLARQGSTTTAGEWSATLLDAGAYRLEIATSAGAVVTAQSVDINEDTVLTVRVESIPLEGSLTLDGDPLAGSIALIGNGGSRLNMRSNDDGAFQGIVPREGPWRAAVSFGSPAQQVNIPEVVISRKNGETAYVNIDLPGGSLEGNVIDESGAPVDAALMLFNKHGLETTLRSDEKGAFRFVGLAEGPREIMASAKMATSGRVPVMIADGADQHVMLIVRSTVAVRGVVHDMAGNPVPGALIRVATAGGMPQETTTGLTGGFIINVPISARAGLAVIAAGLPRKLMTFQAGTDQPPPLLQVTSLGAAGILHVQIKRRTPPWPYLTHDGSFFFGIPELFLPRSAGPPVEFSGDKFTFALEPGSYSVCPGPRLNEQCTVATLTPGTEATVVWPSHERSRP